MNKFFCGIIAAAVLTLSGCASSNINQFQPDPLQAHYIKNNVKGTVHVDNFTMEKGNSDSILCRFSGNVYLPNKMTFSEYIKSAFEKNLILANKYETSAPKAAHQLSADILSVDFNTIGGTWEITANVSIDGNRPVYIESKTEYGTSFDAYSACKNTAESFQTAVHDFVKTTLENHKIIDELS